MAGNATIWSTGSFPVTGRQDDGQCSIELWMQPGVTNASNTILSFTTPENPLQLSIHQYRSTLIVQRYNLAKPHRFTIGVDGVFRQTRPVFVTLASSEQETAIYVDGVVARKFPRFRFGNVCTGRLVIGTSPIDDDSWPGQIRGVAIYRQALPAAQVFQHYQTWTLQGRPELSGDESTVALFLLNERAGSIVHNAIPGGLDLYIPKRYALVHQWFLEPFWREYNPGWEHWKDILVNIGGFIPFGFVFCYYWTSVRPIKRGVLLTTALGLAVSLTIEVLQSFLPTRNSGTTDLFTNTLGTFLGAKLYDLAAVRALVARIYRP